MRARRVFSLTCFAFLVFVSLDRAAAQGKTKTVRLLTVGNSFSQNATRYLDDLAKARGHTLIHRPLAVGGASMELHWNKAQLHERDPADPKGLYGKKSLKQELMSDAWGYVTIQQASIRSHDVATYRPFARQLHDYIKKAAPKAEILIHQTWAYRVDDPRFMKPPKAPGEPATQKEMYDGLTSAYKTIAGELGVRLIPVGRAMYLADTNAKWGYRPDKKFDSKNAAPPSLPDQTRSLHTGWRWTTAKDGKKSLTMDGHHASVAGQYLAACVFYEVLFAESVVDNPFVPQEIERDYARFLRETAHQAQARTGRYRGELPDPATGEVMMKVAMQVPEKLPAEKHLGLIFLFHGFKGHENNYIGLTVEALKRLKLDDQYVVISGKSKGPGWTTADDEPVLRVMKWARETYPIDPRRVFIFGSSNGAAYVGRFGSAHQELIAGVIGYCGNYKFAPGLKDRPAELRNEWYFVHGGKDRPQNSRRACDTLKELGYRYIFRQMDGYGHTDIWDSIGHPDKTKANAVRDDWILWLHALRHKEIAPAPGELQRLATLAGEAALNEAERIGGEQGSTIIAAALASPKPSVRAAAAKTTTRTLFDTRVIARLIQLLNDETAQVRDTAIEGLTTAANWRNTDAQAALSRQATASNTPLVDRLRAIAALGRASRLPLLGNCEDGVLIWSLVLLLDDEQRSIREAAFAALEKHVPDTFGYSVDLAGQERSAVMQRWTQWCREKCGPVPTHLPVPR